MTIKNIFLGNMSNPSINRWGLNLFWYNFWYNDKISSLIIQQDILLDKFVNIYLQFGFVYDKNIFINKHWFSNYNLPYFSINTESNLKYFRLVEYKNKIINQYKSYKIRNQIKNTYFSKLWILRFQNWLILNIYAFKPLITRNKKLIKKKKEINLYTNSLIKNNFKINRLKFFFHYFFSKLNKNFYYKF